MIYLQECDYNIHDSFRYFDPVKRVYIVLLQLTLPLTIGQTIL